MLKAQSLRTRSVFVSAIALATASLATAQPVPDQVWQHGDGMVSFLDLPGFFQINAPHQSVIQYFSFNVPGGFHVNFNQTIGGNQSPNAAVLNYIPGATPSSIFGQVTGNGIIYMVNPQGFIFGGGAEVSANRFFAAASTLSAPANFFSDADLFNVFPATPFNPNSDPIPSVINFGSIHANEAVHLLGPLVRNFGQISTGNNGLITMTAHNGTVTLGNGGNFYVHVANGGADIDDYGVINTGDLTTGTGGTVMLGAGDMYSLAIRLEGSGIQAANLVLGGDGANPGETNTQGDVHLGSDVIIAADNATFHGTIDSISDQFHGLTINPFSDNGDEVTFNARVGSAVGGRLGHLAVDSGTINVNTDQIYTGSGNGATGNQTYDGNVLIGTDSEMHAHGTIAFGGTLNSTGDGDVSDLHNLSISGDQTITFGGAVGGNTDGIFGNMEILAGTDLNLSHSISVDDFLQIGTMNGNVTQTGGSITANRLLLLTETAGNFTLDQAGNNVNTLAAAINGTLAYTDSSALIVGSIFGFNGINTQGNNVTLNTGGKLTLAEQILATDSRVHLNVALGGVNQTGGAITAGELLLTGAGDFTLDQAGNTVDTLAAAINGALSYTDSSTLTVGSIGGTDGIDTQGNNVTLNTDGQLTLAEQILATGSRVHLNVADGGVNQTGGAITAGELLLTGAGAGDFTLDQAGNNVNTLAAAVNGNLSYRDTAGFAIGQINGTDGITATNTTLEAGGTVTQSQAIDTSALQLLGGGSYTLTHASNSVSTLGADIGGSLNFFNDGNYAVSGIEAGSFVTLGGNNATIRLNGDILTQGGEININAGLLLGDPASIQINSAHGAAAGAGANINFNGTINDDQDDPTAQFTVSAGSGNISFGDAIGGQPNGQIGDLAVNTTGHTHFTSTVNAASVTTSPGGTTQLDGSVTTTGGQTYNNDVTTFNGITLTGTTIAFNDILRPGGANVGTLNIVGNLNLHSLDWQIASNGSFDQIIVSGGNVTLLGGNITGSLINDFLPANQTSFRIINNTDGNPIDGQFAQGGEMFDTTGRLFEINYAAGGNHLDLTKVPRDRIWSGGGADNLWLTALNWLDGFAPDPEDRLIFGLKFQQANFNNFAAGTLFESITFNTGGFTLSGNALNLSHGLFTLAGAGSNAINLNVTTTQAQNWSIADGTTLTLNGALTLGDGLTVSRAGTMQFGGTIDGDHALIVNGAGTVRFGEAVNVNSLTTSGGFTELGANVTTTGLQEYDDFVTLIANVTLESLASVTFGALLNSDFGGNRDLTVISPLTRFEGNVGTAAGGRLGTVTTDAAGVTHLAANQFLAANWLFNDAVILEANATVDGTDSVIFGSTLNSDVGGNRNLTVNSPLTRFEGNVGTAADTRLGTVTTDAAGTTFLAASDLRAQTWQFNDDVVLEADVVLDATAGVTFGALLNSENGGNRNLTVNSPLTRFEGNVGTGDGGRLGFLDVTGTDININGGIVNTNDYQRYDGAVWLGADTEMTAGGYVHFTSTVNSAGGVAEGNGGESLMHSLRVNSNDDVTFDGAVGGEPNGILGFLEVFAANDIHINGGYVNTNEHQFYDGAVKLGADTVMDAGTHVTFTRSVDNALGNNDDDDDNGEGGADGRASLTVNSGGMVTFNGAVGGGPNGQLRFLEVNANNIDVNGSFVNTDEHQLYNGATRIGGFLTIMLAGGDVTFTETLDSSGDGASSDRNHLRVQSGGQVTFQKAVGGAADGRFASLDITGDQININGGLMQSFGVQEYHGAVRLGMNTLLHAEAGGILIDGTLDSEVGKQVGLTVNTPGLLTLGGAVGGNDQLSSFQRNGGGATAINGGLVRTVNGQNYGSGAVSIGANADLIAGTTVAFGGTVNSANGTHALAIRRNNGVGGNATFGNSVGQNSPLSNLMVEGATTFGGQQGGNVVSITTTQDQTYGDGLGNNDITLLSHATLNGRTITARGQINGQNHDITINATDMIDLYGDVDVRRFETGQGGTTHLRNGLALTARQLVKIDNALQLHGHTLVSVTEVSPFMFAVEFRSINGAHDLMVESHSGGIRFNDRIGGTTALNNLSANAMNGGQILFDTLESANGNPFVMLTGNLMLNTDVGPQQDPTVAKIGATGDLWIQSNGNFVMGRGQKLTAIGSVIIDVANAIIGDISALNNIEINANTITILLRPAAEGFDQGVDFVAGGMILFSVIPDLDGEGPQPQFATPDGLGGTSIATLQGFLVRALDYVVGDVQGIQDANTTLEFPDLVATGAASTDLSTALAAEMPDEGGTDEADTEASLAGDDVAILAQRGFIVRILEHAELVELVQGRGVYIDGRTERVDVPGIDGEAPVFLAAGLEIDPANVRPQGLDPAILQRSPVLAKQRVSRGLLDSVVSAIDRLRTVDNPETGVQESRIDLVRPALDSMWRMFTADHPGAPAREFPEYLRRIIENPIDDDELEVASEALNFLRDVADLRDGLHAFGMSRREARMTLVEIIRPFLAADVSVSNFFEALEGLER